LVGGDIVVRRMRRYFRQLDGDSSDHRLGDDMPMQSRADGSTARCTEDRGRADYGAAPAS
jgi:hypothetical protein